VSLNDESDVEEVVATAAAADDDDDDDDDTHVSVSFFISSTESTSTLHHCFCAAVLQLTA